jgi:phospholipid/cholesterol/gamma-HCH transport system permease protein
VRNTVQVCNDTALLLALATTPATWSAAWRARLSQQVVSATWPQLPWFTVLAALIGLVLIRIVVVTALSYGLSQYAVDMVVRVLVLELIPLAAALFVALRITIPQGAELMRWRQEGRFAQWQQQGRDVMHWLVLPRALAGMFSVIMLATVSCLVALVLAYLNIYGFNPWGMTSYTRIVGQVFNPVVTLIFTFKTLFFALTVALIPLASSLYDEPRPDQVTSPELQMLVRMFLSLLVIELVSLMGNYY